MIYAIVGNVGTGKTTLIRRLRSARNDVYYVEEVRSRFLIDCNARGIFGFQNQVHYYCQCLEAAQESVRGKIVVQDRCILDMHSVFSRRLHELRLIEEREYQLLSRMKELTMNMESMFRFIYLRADCNTLLNRIRARGESGDADISMDVVRHLDLKYADWYGSVKTDHDLLIDTSETPIEGLVASTLAWMK